MLRGISGRGIAEWALERRADARMAALDGNDPRPHLPGRIVANVLGVAALEVGNPMVLVVLVKAHNAPGRHGA